jgi:trimeric autotransporter adhesin
MGGILSLFIGSGTAAAQAITRVPAITTTAGNGTAGYSGDNGPAAGAELNNPYGMSVDSSGNLYIADATNNRIRKVAVGTGVISTFAGNGAAGYSGDGGAATSATLNSPEGVTFDTLSGVFYIADTRNNVIRSVSTAGVITTIAGNNAQGYSGDNGAATNATLDYPTGVARDSVGNLYIADFGNNRVREVTMAGTITTFAGTGAAGYSGDNGPAASAALNKPSALAIDSANNLYILDTNNSVVREVSTAGTITTVAGNGTAGYSGEGGAATSASLNLPYGLSIDSSGNLYIADSGNNVVREVSTAGVITTIIGDGTPGFSGDGGPGVSATLSNPLGVALDSQGNLYVSDEGNQRLRSVSVPTGSVAFPTTAVGAASTAVTIPLQVNVPDTTITSITAAVSQGGEQEYSVSATGCALNTPLSAGTLCNVTLTFSPAYAGARWVPLQVASSAGAFTFGMAGIGTGPQVALSPGIITTVPGTANLSPASLIQYFSGNVAVDSAGTVYVVVIFQGQESVFEITGGTVTGGVGLGTLKGLRGLALAVDSAGTLYVASPDYGCVSKLTSSGFLVVVAGTEPAGGGGYCYPGVGGYGGDNGLATNASLSGPAGLAVDSANNLYIADSGNNRIRKVTAATGIITTVAGTGAAGDGGDNGPATAAQLNNPRGLAIDSAGNLYIGDTNNNRIRKIDAGSGIITTVAGNGTPGYSGDNGPATSAELYSGSLAVDGAGDIYAADGANNVIRMVNTAGIITTVAGGGTSGLGDGGPATSAEITAYGVATDSAGNLYIAGGPSGTSSGVYGVRTVNVSTSALNYPTTPIGSASTQTVAVTNIGNAPLSFTVPVSGYNPSITTGFALDSSSSCPQLGAGGQPSTLASGASCAYAFDFLPVTTSSANGTGSITDNALNTNSAVQTVQLSGAGGEIVETTTTINVGTAFFGQTQVSATILAVTGTVTPVGSVVFTVDGAVQPAAAVNNSGVATLPAAVSNALAVGSHTIAAVYTSSAAGFTNSNAIRIFTVGQPPSVTIAPSSTSLSVAAGSSVTDTISATPVGGYTGTLAFSCNNLPQNATCSFKPATVALTATSGAQSLVVTIQTAGGTAKLERWNGSPTESTSLLPAAAFWTPGLIPFAFAVRRRRLSARGYHLVLLLALLAGIGVMTGCGGSSAASSTPPTTPTPPSTPVTPAGTSAVQIIATNAGTQVQSFTLTLTVQ